MTRAKFAVGCVAVVFALIVTLGASGASAQTASAAACGAAANGTFASYQEMVNAGLCATGSTAKAITQAGSAWAWSCTTATSAVACAAAVSSTPPPTCTSDWCLSALYLEKRDGTNTKEHQTVPKGGTATFTISIMNGGYIPLMNVTVSDLLAPECNRTAAQTAQLYGGTFDPGEIFSYKCALSNVQESFDNVAMVNAVTPNDHTVLTVYDDTHVDVVVPTPPVDGVCGSAHGTTVDTAPTNGLCAVGTSTPVTGNGPWSWQCVGSNGGQTVNCEAYKKIPANPAISLEKRNGDNSGDTQTVAKGGTATFTITVKNTGNVSLRNVVIDDRLSPECNRTADNTKALYGDAFTPGESFSYTCAKSNVQESYTNVAVVTGESDSGGKTTDTDDSHVAVQQQPANHPAIDIEKRNGDNSGDTQTVAKGGTAMFTITVTNTGNVNLTGVVVSDQRVADCNRTAAQTAQLYGGTFEPGEVFRYTCKHENVQESYENVAVVTSDTPGTPDDDDDTDVVVPKDPDKKPGIEVKKQNGDNSGDTQTVAKGGTATFTITVKNTGETTLTNVKVTDRHVVDCNRTAAQTAKLYGDTFDPGESFRYTCTQENVQESYRNVVVVQGETPGGDTPDDSDDSNVVVAGDKPDKPKKKKQRCDASIGDLVWHDRNKNGVQDNGEEGIADVRLKLYNGNDVERKKTNGSGKYSFKDLCEGTYTVVVDAKTLPKGCYQVYDRDGKLDNKTTVKLDNDEHYKKADFGYYCPSASVSKKSPKTGPGAVAAGIAAVLASGVAYATSRRMKRA